MAETGAERLKKIAADLRRGESSPEETVRTLLSWFDAKRRGSWVTSRVRDALEFAGLHTEPDFEGAYIDAPVIFKLKDAQEGSVQEFVDRQPDDQQSSNRQPQHPGSPPHETNQPTPIAVAVAEVTQVTLSPVISDPSFRLSKLAAANKSPTSVKPDAPLAEAVTLMLSKGYSQVPVMSSERDVKGVITWESIAARLALKREGTTARQFMDQAQILPGDASLFTGIRVIIQHQYVLVQSADRRIVGIVTASDLSLQFQALTEPFLLLSEIENDLRRVLQTHFTVADLSAARDPADTRRQVESVHDMTFGEYVRLLENPNCWSRLNVALDRRAFVERLKRIGEIRNDVMHFDPDGIPEEDVKELQDFSQFLQRLRDLGAT